MWSVFDVSDSSVTCVVSGNDVTRLFSLESGIHRVQRVPPTESKGRRHTSTVAVAILPLLKIDTRAFNLADISITYAVGHGKGGQHRNKTESAVRATHVPTGITAYIQNNRSQHTNRERAIQVIATRLADTNNGTMQDEHNAIRRQQIGNMSRSGARVRTYNFIENRVTDERSSKKFRTEDIMRGRLELIYKSI